MPATRLPPAENERSLLDEFQELVAACDDDLVLHHTKRTKAELLKFLKDVEEHDKGIDAATWEQLGNLFEGAAIQAHDEENDIDRELRMIELELPELETEANDETQSAVARTIANQRRLMGDVQESERNGEIYRILHDLEAASDRQDKDEYDTIYDQLMKPPGN